MFGKFKNKMHESQDSVEVDIATVPTVDCGTSKKKMSFKGPEMVLVGGLVVIIGGMFWFMSTGPDDNKIINTDSNNSEETNISKQEKQPFVYENKMKKQTNNPVKKIEVVVKEEIPFVYENNVDFSTDNLVPPPEEYEQNNTIVSQKISKTKIPNPVKVGEKEELKASEPIVQRELVKTKEVLTKQIPVVIKNNPIEVSNIVNVLAVKQKKRTVNSTISNAGYVCSIVDDYQNMLGKEIMYYIKNTQTHKYIPAYSKPNWDESGVLVKKKLMVTQVDMNERMAEVDKGKWIPALEFMTCVVVQESGQ